MWKPFSLISPRVLKPICLKVDTLTIDERNYQVVDIEVCFVNAYQLDSDLFRRDGGSPPFENMGQILGPSVSDDSR